MLLERESLDGKNLPIIIKLIEVRVSYNSSTTMDKIYDLAGKDNDSYDVIKAILDKLVKLEDKAGGDRHLYIGGTEHSDYKSGYLINYLYVAVRAKNEKVAKTLMVLLNWYLNGYDTGEVVGNMAELLKMKLENGVMVKDKKLPKNHYPLITLMSFLEDYWGVSVEKYDFLNSSKCSGLMIKTTLGANNQITVERNLLDIDIWDIYRLYAKAGLEEDGEYGYIDILEKFKR